LSLLTVDQLTHAFGDKVILDNVSLRLLAGEHIGLVGANGVGKSTLLHIIAKQLLPDQGAVTWLPGVNYGHLQQHVDLSDGLSMRDFLRSAFAWLYNVEREMLRVTEKMALHSSDNMDELLKKFGHHQETLENNDFYGLDAKIEEVAAGLGLTELCLDTAVERLSGGQRTKLLLAKLLLERPHALLLDEPTNFLDAEHIQWLTGYLKTYPHAFVLVTHEDAFMNAVINVVYHLEHHTLARYTGNVSQFRAAYQLRKNQTLQAFGRQQEEIKKLETYIQKNKYRASTAKQAKSREKRLDKIVRVQQPVLPASSSFHFKVNQTLARTVIEAQGLLIGYEHPLLPPLNLKLMRGQKVAITGYNGIGKTTSLKTLLGYLQPLGGQLQIGDGARPAYFEQEVSVQPTHTALEDIWSEYPLLTQKEVRQALARCGLKTEHIFQPLHTLSGGEQTKVRLCKIVLAKSNWLVLDEPTNHLDLQAKGALRDALAKYDGTVLLVSHEPDFYLDWVTDIWDVEAIAEAPINMR